MFRLTVVFLGNLCLALPAWPTEPAAPGAATSDPELAALREPLAAATDDAAWDRAARALLRVLDKKRLGSGSEATWLIDRLLVHDPDNPEWLWRRADQRIQAGEVESAIADCERLAKQGIDEPLAVRALRALPLLYGRLGDSERSAAADERLLELKLGDPQLLLGRLAKSYETLGQSDAAASVLERLRALGASDLDGDADLQWLAADAAARAGRTQESAQLLIDFAKKFHGDPREPEALLRAAQSLKELGQEAMALDLADQAITKASATDLRARGHMERADLLVQRGRIDEAEAEYLQILQGNPDLMQTATALHDLVKLTKEHRGLASTLFQLAAIARRPDRFASPLAKRHFQTLLWKEGAALAQQPIDAAAVVALAETMQVVQGIPPALRLAAAQLREQVGARESAKNRYGELVDEPESLGREARYGQMRADPKSSSVIPPDDPDRLVALRAGEAWKEIDAALTGRLDGRGGAAKRTLAAQSAFAQKDPRRALALLDPLQGAGSEPLLLRADARALDGRWKEACADYRAVAESPPNGAARDWLEFRLARCELRDEDNAAARARLAALVAAKPTSPTALTAKRLLDVLSPPPSAEAAVTQQRTP